MVIKYKSKHTGAQVDEAVSRVLNGEVGGGATPNWLAVHGEPEYIVNKPFGWDSYETYSFRKFIDKYKISLITSTNDTGPVFECYLGFNVLYDLYTILRLDYIDVKSIGYSPVVIQQTGFKLSYVFKGEGSSEGYYLTFTHYDEYGYQNDITFDELIEYIDKYSSTVISTAVDKRVLSSEFISDTVIKTTPQKLSDADKNQALSNLGIDPVALKYMINPLVINYEAGDMKLPEDLANIVLTDGKFNQSVLNMIIGWDGQGYYGVSAYNHMNDYPHPTILCGNMVYELDIDSLVFDYQ